MKKRSSNWAASILSVRSATKAAASITSCVAAPAGKAIPVRPASISRWKTTCCVSSAPSGSPIHAQTRHGRGRADRAWHGHRAIENAQKKVEAHNFEIRKQLLEYDDVMNKQREVIYQHRRAILTGERPERRSQESSMKSPTRCSTSIPRRSVS